MDIGRFFSAEYNGSKDFKQLDVPTANATGFGSAADDYMERGIDLNEQLIRNKPATFFMRVQGSSMINAHIHDGDIVIVDRSIKPQSGKIIIAIIDGEMIIRRLEKIMNKSPTANNRFKKLRATWFYFLHLFSLSLYGQTNFLQVIPQILKPAKRYAQF